MSIPANYTGAMGGARAQEQYCKPAMANVAPRLRHCRPWRVDPGRLQPAGKSRRAPPRLAARVGAIAGITIVDAMRGELGAPRDVSDHILRALLYQLLVEIGQCRDVRIVFAKVKAR